MLLLESSFYSSTNKFSYSLRNYFHKRKDDNSICVQATCRILSVININSRAADCRVITCGVEHQTTVNGFAGNKEVFLFSEAFEQDLEPTRPSIQ